MIFEILIIKLKKNMKNVLQKKTKNKKQKMIKKSNKLILIAKNSLLKKINMRQTLKKSLKKINKNDQSKI